MSKTFVTTYANTLRRLALPLAAYYAITLAVPLANGAASSDTAFLKHAVVVLVVPLGTLGLGCVVTCRWNAVKRWLANPRPVHRHACSRNWL